MRTGKKLIAGGMGVLAAGAAVLGISMSSASPPPTTPASTTPIKHVVVIFDENISFDHYFGTYPHATNPAGEPSFTALPGTPAVNGLNNGLLTEQSQRGPASAPGSEPGSHLRSEPRLLGRAGSLRRRPHERLRPEDDGQRLHPEHDPRLQQLRAERDRDGLLRRQHGHRAVEPGAALLAERQLLQHSVRAVEPRCHQPDLRSDQRRRSAWRHVHQHRQRHAVRRRRALLRSVLQPEHAAQRRRHARRSDGLDDRQEHRRSDERQGRHLGLVPGWLRAFGSQGRAAADLRLPPTRTSVAPP